MEQGGLIYLDNAATTYPKPPEVYSEVVRTFIQRGGNAGRGSHSLSMAAAEKIYECREAAARLFGVSDAERVIFTFNATYALNTVIKGLVRQGDHVLISDLEHNAVYRPIYKLAKEGVISYDVFGTMPVRGESVAERVCSDIARKLKKNTRMVVCAHSSNICSFTLPIKEIAEFCHRCGVLFVLDAAQSAGHENISVDKMKIDALCVPSHKGLYGPQGGGMVILGRGIVLDTLAEGGNGVNSLEGGMPDFSPERYEAGTLPTATIAGLCAGINFVSEMGIENISRHEKALFRRAREFIGEIKGAKIYLPEYEGSVLLFNIDGYSADTLCRELDRDGICVRSGYHCAALAHRTLKTREGGAVRISFGAFNTEKDIDSLYKSLKNIK